MNALASIAYDQREESLCPVEPSARVREAAAQGLLLCGCYKRPGFVPDGPDVVPAPMPIPLPDPDVLEAPAPLPLRTDETEDRGEGVLEDRGEGALPGLGRDPLGRDPLDLESRRNPDGDLLDGPRAPGDTDADGKYEPEIDPGDSDRFERLEDALDPTARRSRPAPRLVRPVGYRSLDPLAAAGSAPAPFAPAAHAAADAPPLAALDTLCVVALRAKSFAPADPRYKTVHGGRTYFFSSPRAKAAFEADPALYAPAFCGMDPVAYLDAGELTEGAVLRQHGGRFYLFATAANWEAFRADPARYAVD